MRSTDPFNVTPEILNQMLNFYNLSRQKFIQTYKLQPLVYIPELPFAAKVTFVVVYCATFLLAFCGNTLVLCIVKRGKRSRTVTTIFICSLAVSDLLITFFCIPFTLLQNISSQWVGGFAWAVAVIVGSPMLYVQQLEVKYDFLYERRYVSCLECWNSASLRKAYAVFILVALFLLPQLVMLLLYSRIVFELWIKKRVGDNSFLNALNQREMSKIAKKKKRAVVIMITIVVLFTICWAPFHVVYILFEFNKLDEIYDDVTVNMIIAVVQAIGFFNSFNNPIIYTFMNETFKNDCFSFLSCCAHRRHQKATARVQNPNVAARLAAWVEDPPQMRKHMKPENNNQVEHVELNWCVNYKLATREPAQLPMLPCATHQDLPCTSGHG
ncbi:pyroglutamylated RF-amide peptide receptor-like isoform X2 [Chiloscyllium punctatum]|uniref:pyroglutamylated RF-amide peptide receptor-like isoform X2 n=1 Tax=Chiloscyllium punctatum TaxID=137246 RepID=UPI003B637340